MAQRRMFSLAICDADRFLELPVSTQALYFHFGLRADDDGFVSSPKRILRTVGCAEDDLRLLITKKFVIPFESGVVVITDWGINNFIRTDRYHETMYLAEKSLICKDETGSYNLVDTAGIPDDNRLSYQMEPEVRLGKVSIELYSCAELSADADTPHQPPVIELPLNDKSLYPISEEQAKAWAGLYPAVDVIQQLRSMKGWLNANPTRRKTKTGILKFVNGWLSREQNKGGAASVSDSPSEPQRRFVEIGVNEYGDPDGYWEEIT